MGADKHGEIWKARAINVWAAAFSHACDVKVNHTIADTLGSIEVYLPRDSPDPQAMAALGLLGRMLETPIALQFFEKAPTTGELTECALTALTLHERRRARRAPPALYWIVTGGSVKKLLPEFGFTPLDGWPAGVYAAAPLLGMRLIAASELPRTKETLALRQILRTAAKKLAADPSRQAPKRERP